jgi:hypothetical protein
MLRLIDWYIVPEVLEETQFFLLQGQQWKKSVLGLLDREDEGITNLRSVGKCSPAYKALIFVNRTSLWSLKMIQAYRDTVPTSKLNSYFN